MVFQEEKNFMLGVGLTENATDYSEILNTHTHTHTYAHTYTHSCMHTKETSVHSKQLVGVLSPVNH